ncbi:menaquinone biosynthesis family protein [Sphingobacterium sp. HJSM2_6]|uniref:menaquinone biosynthesis family protein n=1 Tax=Sphingobacterium sp. HJSM2_6 TaxID=3366264 RepID=UPI003BE0D083
MELTLGFSPCPNDTFIFDALIHNKIDTQGLQFHVEYHDVETLNSKAFRGDLAITKLSYHAFAYAVEAYELLDAGSALGFGVGPLLICKNPSIAAELGSLAGQDIPASWHDLRIGIPGKFTTANFLLGMAYPQWQNKTEMLFSSIEQALLDDEIDVGLIIHENRFTYQDKGLFKLVDLGDFWEKTTGSPIPLGGIVVKRSLPQEVKLLVNQLIRQSVTYAFDHPKSGLDYIRSHAQEMKEEVMYKHIELYVNQYSIDLGEKGKEAINQLFDKARALNLIPTSAHNIFLEK